MTAPAGHTVEDIASMIVADVEAGYRDHSLYAGTVVRVEVVPAGVVSTPALRITASVATAPDAPYAYEIGTQLLRMAEARTLAGGQRATDDARGAPPAVLVLVDGGRR